MKILEPTSDEMKEYYRLRWKILRARNDKTEEYAVLINPDGSFKENNSKGLDREYITQWSYGIFESINLFIPRLMGGGTSEDVGVDSNFYKLLRSNGKK